MAELVYSVQSEGLSPLKPQKPSRPDWTPIHDGLNSFVLRHEFDSAARRADLDELHRIAFLTEKVETNPTQDHHSIKALYKCVALPLYEQVFSLQSGFEAGEHLRTELNLVHPATILLLEKAFTARASAHTAQADRDLTGAISELTVAALLNSGGSYAPYAALPTSGEEDQGFVTPSGERTGFDFTLFPVDEVTLPIKLQVKTSETGSLHPYESDILVVAVQGLTNTYIEAFAGLPRALIHDEAGVATEAERALITQAYSVLIQKIDEYALKNKNTDV